MMSEPATKRRRLSPPEVGNESDSSQTSNADPADLLAFAQHWNLEQDYERRPRKKSAEKAENSRLPVKTPEGGLQKSTLPEVEHEEDEESDQEVDNVLLETEEDEPAEPDIPVRQQILEAKEELAREASLLNEDPEGNSGAFRILARFSNSKIPTIKKLALVTQLSVYKDVIPGYRIRPLPENGDKERISKDVKRLRSFEQSLVSHYQTYVRKLSSLAGAAHGKTSQDGFELATVAISCACALVITVPHFNFRGELLKIIMDQLKRKDQDVNFVKCRETLEKLFEDDENGAPSLDAVTQLTKMIKSRNYQVDESVLNTLLHLHLLSSFGSKASQSKVNRQNDGEKKAPKQKRVFLSKRQRKLLRENKSIEKEMSQADASVAYEEREKMQGETLKLVFVTYFRILKSRPPALMGAVLEGLAKYAHLINQDFFVDVLEALKDMMGRVEDDEDPADLDREEDAARSTRQRDKTREILLCIITAFALLQGQVEGTSTSNARSLNLDLNFFTSSLYRTLHPLALNADIELSRQSIRLPDPSSHTAQASTRKVDIKSTTILLLRALSAVLQPYGNVSTSSIPPIRLAAFSKQLMTSSLQLPEKSTIALLSLLQKISKTQKRKFVALWHTEERRDDGVYLPLNADFESCNPYASTIWEGEILRRHYCPSVRENIKILEKSIIE